MRPENGASTDVCLYRVRALDAQKGEDGPQTGPPKSLVRGLPAEARLWRARARGLPGRRLVEPGGSDGAIQHDRHESTIKKMSQLTENKPRRRALIATLSHFSARRRCFVGRSFSSDITDDARSAYRCAGSIAACIRSFDRSSKSRNSNRNIRRLETHLTLGQSTRNPFLIATKLHIVKPRFYQRANFRIEGEGSSIRV